MMTRYWRHKVNHVLAEHLKESRCKLQSKQLSIFNLHVLVVAAVGADVTRTRTLGSPSVLCALTSHTYLGQPERAVGAEVVGLGGLGRLPQRRQAGQHAWQVAQQVAPRLQQR